MQEQNKNSIQIEDRLLTHDFSPGYLREFMDMDRVEEELERVLQQFENTYDAVAWYEKNSDFYAGGVAYRVRVIPSRRANRRIIKRGLEEMRHWLTENGDNDEQ